MNGARTALAGQPENNQANAPAQHPDAAPADALCRAHCESRYCGRRKNHRGLHETPPGEPLSSGGHRFGTLHPPGWNQADDLAADRALYSARAVELSRMATTRLRELYSGQLTEIGRAHV